MTTIEIAATIIFIFSGLVFCTVIGLVGGAYLHDWLQWRLRIKMVKKELDTVFPDEKGL